MLQTKASDYEAGCCRTHPETWTYRYFESMHAHPISVTSSLGWRGGHAKSTRTSLGYRVKQKNTTSKYSGLICDKRGSLLRLKDFFDSVRGSQQFSCDCRIRCGVVLRAEIPCSVYCCCTYVHCNSVSQQFWYWLCFCLRPLIGEPALRSLVFRTLIGEEKSPPIHTCFMP